MSKMCYELNPSWLISSKNYTNASAEVRGVYLGLMNQMWLSETQYSIPLAPGELSTHLGIGEGDLAFALSALGEGEDPLVIEAFDFDNGFILESPHLKAQVAKHRAWLMEEKIRTIERNKDSQRSTLTERVCGAPMEIGTAYLPPEERALGRYQGWFPTSRFDSAGQVFYVRPTFVEQLSESYPGITIEVELEKMFRWKADNPTKRKTIGYMNRFIWGWFERVSSGAAATQSVEKADEITSELDALFGEKYGK